MKRPLLVVGGLERLLCRAVDIPCLGENEWKKHTKDNADYQKMRQYSEHNPATSAELEATALALLFFLHKLRFFVVVITVLFNDFVMKWRGRTTISIQGHSNSCNAGWRWQEPDNLALVPRQSDFSALSSALRSSSGPPMGKWNCGRSNQSIIGRSVGFEYVDSGIVKVRPISSFGNTPIYRDVFMGIINNNRRRVYLQRMSLF